MNQWKKTKPNVNWKIFTISDSDKIIILDVTTLLNEGKLDINLETIEILVT